MSDVRRRALPAAVGVGALLLAACGGESTTLAGTFEGGRYWAAYDDDGDFDYVLVQTRAGGVVASVAVVWHSEDDPEPVGATVRPDGLYWAGSAVEGGPLFALSPTGPVAVTPEP